MHQNLNQKKKMRVKKKRRRQSGETYNLVIKVYLIKNIPIHKIFNDEVQIVSLVGSSRWSRIFVGVTVILVR